jgi:hypothetical protein
VSFEKKGIFFDKRGGAGWCRNGKPSEQRRPHNNTMGLDHDEEVEMGQENPLH